jgi:hypothetical protein
MKYKKLYTQSINRGFGLIKPIKLLGIANPKYLSKMKMTTLFGTKTVN